MTCQITDPNPDTIDEICASIRGRWDAAETVWRLASAMMLQRQLAERIGLDVETNAT